MSEPRRVLLACRIGGHADVQIADELGGPLVADALAASLERSRDDERLAGTAIVIAAGRRAWDLYKASGGTGEAA